MTEVSSVHGHVIRGIWTEKAQLRWTTWRTGLAWQSEEYKLFFFWRGNCLGFFFTDDVTPLNENPQLHMAQQNRNLLQNFGWGKMDHPPYALDLAPSDFSIFHTLTEHFSGHRVTYDEDVKDVPCTCLTEQEHVFYPSRMDRLVSRCNNCLNLQGSYV